MTDISGFGLSSHLLDICLSSNLSCELVLSPEILINSNIDLLRIFKVQVLKITINLLGYIKYQRSILLQYSLDPKNGPMLITINKQNQKNLKIIFSNEIDRLKRLFLVRLFKN